VSDEPAGRAHRVSRAFRAALARELPLWRDEGLVDERAAAELTARYRLGEGNADLAAAAIYTLGALLVGGGVISFVAWNWDALHDVAKLALGGAVMTAFHAVGWWLWRVRATWPRVGHALMLVGTLVFGADIGLVAQVFHISSSWSAGYGAWALGAAVAAWALRSAPHGCLGAALAGVWACGWAVDHPEAWPLPPALVLAVFVPLAWRLGSRWVFATVALAFGVGLACAAGAATRGGGGVVVAILGAAAALLAWQFAFDPSSRGALFSTVARRLGLVATGVTCYLVAFRDLAREVSFTPSSADSGALAWEWAVLAVGVPVALLVRVLALEFSRVPMRAAEPRSRVPSVVAIAGATLVALGTTAGRDSAFLVVAANAALAATGIAAVAASVQGLERRTFWWGTLLLALLVVTRFLEYETNLGIKALVFVATGAAVIVVGIVFERRLRAQAVRDAA
jgi:uncharacterized membrane protein